MATYRNETIMVEKNNSLGKLYHNVKTTDGVSNIKILISGNYKYTTQVLLYYYVLTVIIQEPALARTPN